MRKLKESRHSKADPNSKGDPSDSEQLLLRPRKSGMQPSAPSLPSAGQPKLNGSKGLGVWSRDEVVRVDLERGRVSGPSVTDGLERGSPSQRFQVLGEVVGGDEGQDVG